MRPIPNQRIDWAAFFVQFACLQRGAASDLPGIPADAPEGLRTEKRLARIIEGEGSPRRAVRAARGP